MNNKQGEQKAQPDERRLERLIVPIVFCADAGYGSYLSVALQSVLDNASAAHDYHIIVFDCGIKSADLAVLSRQIALHENFTLRVESVTAFLQENSTSFRIKEGQHLSAATYARLFIPQICTAYERVIYADIDMIFNRDLAELLKLPLGENYIAAVPDINIEFERHSRQSIKNWVGLVLKMQPEHIYVNAGLLLFNIGAWQENNLTAQCLALLTEKPLNRHDQDAVNSVCKGKIFYLPPIWNCTCVIHRRGEDQGYKTNIPYLQNLLREKREALADGAVVYHFVGAVKPWHNLTLEKGAIWWAYARQTELYDRFLGIALVRASRMNYKTGQMTYRLFGIPFWRVRIYPKKNKYSLFGLPIAKTITNMETGDKVVYCCGLKVFSRRYRS